MPDIQFESQIVKTKGGSIIPVPKDIGMMIHKSLGKRVLLRVRAVHDMSSPPAVVHRAIQFAKDKGFYIMAGQSTIKAIGLPVGQQLHIIAEQDNSAYQLNTCAVFDEVVSSDPDAENKFRNLTPGKQRSLIHFVCSAKLENTQINRALAIAENLKGGVTDLRQLLRSK